MAQTSTGSGPTVDMLALDEKYYALDSHESAFFKAQTGIQSDDALKGHIMRIQAEAWKVRPYACVRRFAFTKLKISRLPSYGQFLRLGKERKGAIFLDIGCCFGNDLRKAVADGYPMENTIASDLHPEFWQLGHKLFNTTPETFSAPFLAGDVFDLAFLEPTQPFYSPSEAAVPALSSLTTLTPLRGHLSAIHASSFFHLFSEAGQLQLARSIAGLLSSEPGSMIFGEHGGRPEKGYRTEGSVMRRGGHMFCHSPETWTELWDGSVFKKGSVKVDAFLHEIERDDLQPKEGGRFWIMVWSVTRL
ncbi:hypothetical protein AcW2_001075 [Taiwanofungus camphoratus]|nr:hypothetical protein AcW2_001075 [Antrodia cinnamomea]